MRVLSYRDLKPLKGIAYTQKHIAEMVSRQEFPAPFSLSTRRKVWDEQAIDKWLEQKQRAKPLPQQPGSFTKGRRRAPPLEQVP